MFSRRTRERLREALLGMRFRQMMFDDHLAVSRLGNGRWLAEHPEVAEPGFQAPFNEYEFSRYSQNGEDGLILFLLSRVGVGPRFVVEVGTQDGRECNSANLLLNYGWRGCLLEAEPRWVERARSYFAECGAEARVRVVQAEVTPENVNDLLRDAGVPADLELVSIDIDSFDYWVWEALDFVTPPIVVIEYNASFGPTASVTVPYDGSSFSSSSPFWHGASLTALERLGRRKGYALVGADTKGVNAFFVRRDVLDRTGLAAVEPAAAFRPHHRRGRRHPPEKQARAIAELPVTEVE